MSISEDSRLIRSDKMTLQGWITDWSGLIK